MGLRLFSEFKSSNDKEYKIEIFQDGYTSTSSSFVVDSSGFTLQYQGQTDDIVSPIIGSTCTIIAYNETGAFDNFINKLYLRQEEDFFMKVSQYNGSTYDTYWTGIVLQDLVTELDEAKPRAFKIVASDGIGHLAHEEYQQDGDVTIEELIEAAVGSLGYDEMYASTDTFYATTLNTWDTNITYNAARDVATFIRFDASVYTTREEDGTVVFTNYLDIIKEMCIAFGARFYQKDGVFHFEQYLERVSASRNVATYQFDGTQISVAAVSDDVTLDQTTSGGARLGGNTFNFLPALQKVQVAFDQDRAYNLLASMIHFTPTTTRQSIGFMPNANNARLQMDMTLSYQLTLNTTPPSVAQEFYRPVWEIEIRVEDINNPGTYYYLNRDWVPGTLGAQLYGPTTWETTASTYHMDAGIAINEATGLYLSGPTTLVTPPFPVAGTCEIDINFDQAYDNNNAAQTTPSYFDETVISIARRVMFIDDSGASTTTQVFSSTNTDTRIKSNLTLDLGTLRVSDSAGMAGSFYVYTGTTWVKSTVWARGAVSPFVNLYKLLTKEVLSIHKKPILRYDGTIVSNSNFGQRLVFDSENWIMLRGTFNANFDEWNGEWFAISQDTANITVGDPVGSGGVTTETARVSSQQGTDEIIIAVDVNTTDATIDGTMTNNGAVVTAVNDVSATAGGSTTIDSSNYMNFVSYSGANGTHTINLPAASTGVFLRFKTNETIEANKTVTLTPNGSETIDGETTYVMDRGYDGISLMGVGSQWFVVQKKEK